MRAETRCRRGDRSRLATCCHLPCQPVRFRSNDPRHHATRLTRKAQRTGELSARRFWPARITPPRIDPSRAADGVEKTGDDAGALLGLRGEEWRRPRARLRSSSWGGLASIDSVPEYQTDEKYRAASVNLVRRSSPRGWTRRRRDAASDEIEATSVRLDPSWKPGRADHHGEWRDASIQRLLRRLHLSNIAAAESSNSHSSFAIMGQLRYQAHYEWRYA